MTPAEPGHAAIPRITTSILWARRAPVLHKIESPTVLESDVLFCRVVVYVPVVLLAAALCVLLAWGSVGITITVVVSFGRSVVACGACCDLLV